MKQDKSERKKSIRASIQDSRNAFLTMQRDAALNQMCSRRVRRVQQRPSTKGSADQCQAQTPCLSIVASTSSYPTGLPLSLSGLGCAAIFDWTGHNRGGERNIQKLRAGQQRHPAQRYLCFPAIPAWPGCFDK
jgi:hypothetical protein